MTSVQDRLRLAPSNDLMREAADTIDSLMFTVLGMTERAPRVRHKKRGTFYKVLGHAKASSAAAEGDMLTIYLAEVDGINWARLTEEFDDGRFEAVK